MTGGIFLKVGEIQAADRSISLNAGRPTRTITVVNRADRPIQVGSHFHFFEVNRQLDFDRQAAYGFRLNIPSGTAVRFEPGERYEVELVALGGRGRVFGLQNLTQGQAAPETLERALLRLREEGISGQEETP